ncbi:MAG: glutathione S-transferase [Rhodomicrobium sp.]
MVYRLYYWPNIQGRGEFVRLALEEAGAPYEDAARSERGMAEMMAFLEGERVGRLPFAPPFLQDRDIVIAQTAAILFYLGPKLRLAPRDEDRRLWTHQVQLTIMDAVNEAHDAHHPLGGGRYYEDQKPEALRRAKEFRESRIPKFLGWFERVMDRNPKGSAHLIGDSPSYADLSLFQLVEGLAYAFPRAMRKTIPNAPHVAALHRAVALSPRIKSYCESDRRRPFSEEGVFRHYPELDG